MKDIELEDVSEYNELFGIMSDSEQTSGNGSTFDVTTDMFPLMKEYGSYSGLGGWLRLHPNTVELSNAGIIWYTYIRKSRHKCVVFLTAVKLKQ